jgi:hypothetical protein
VGGKLVYKYVAPAEGAPVADGHMILVGENGNVKLHNVTFQNEYGKYAGVVKATSTGATVTLDGATITHIASMQGNGVVVHSDKANTIVMNDGTSIVGNYVGGNHGLFKLYGGTKMTMNGGEIKNTNGWNANGVVVGIYGAGSELIINDGLISGSSSVWGEDNARHPAVYPHASGKLVMNGGMICNNIGKEYAGGIGSYKSTSDIVINGGLVVDNKSLNNDYRTGEYVERGDDVDVAYDEVMVIYGGIYTHDVGKWCAPGYVCLPYDRDISAYCNLSFAPEGYNHNTRDNDYIVVPGYKVSYHTVSTNAETGETTKELVHVEFLLIPKGKTADEVDLFATPYTHINAEGTHKIDKWFSDAEMSASFNYSTEVTGNIDLYGSNWDRIITSVTITVKDIVYVEGNKVPTNYSYTASVEGIDIDITYTVNGNVINATVAPVEGCVFTIIPGKIVKKEAVAEANGVYYASIQDAINASGKTPTKVTVLKDHTVDVNQRSYGYPILLNGHNITLDLNGKVVTFDYETKTGSYVYASIRTANGAKLTVLDSSAEKTGTLYNQYAVQGEEGPRIIWLTTGCEVVIESGRFVSEQTDTMFYASNSNTEVPVNFFVKGGYFEQIGVTKGNNHDCFNRQDGSGAENIVLSGGTFAFEDPRVGRQNDWEITIADGHTVIYNGVGADGKETWSVSPYITVTFGDVTMVEGETVPEFNYTIDYNYLAKDVIGVKVEIAPIVAPAAGEHKITGTVTLIDGTGEAKNYAVVVISGKLTVTRNTETVEVSGTISWNDANNQDGKRPTSITIHLKAESP